MTDESSRTSSGTDREIRDDWRDDGTAVIGVVDAIVALTGVQPTGLRPLYETVDPDALETATEATGGGILSRDKRESFVRLSRKDGFHLCLVESRDGDFHFSVPDL